MPTKHKRKRNPDADNDYDLPPTVKARPLPVIEPTKDFLTAPAHKKARLDRKNASQQGNSKPKRGAKSADDTPKTFARLMAWHLEGKKIGGGLDDGRKEKEGKGKKGKGGLKRMQDGKGGGNKSTADNGATKTMKGKDNSSEDKAAPMDAHSDEEDVPDVPAVTSETGLKIRPGESLRDFNLRVDQSLPLASVPKHNAKAPAIPGLKEKTYLTKHNKRLARMQADWRKTDARLKAQKEEEEDDMMEKKEEEDALWLGVRAERVKRKGKKRKGQGVIDDDDPWAKLEKARRKEEGKNRGLSAREAVQEPPTLKPVKGIFREDRHRREGVAVS